MENKLHPDVERVLISESELKETVSEIAERINKDYGQEELIVVVILRGSMVFASDIIRKLNMPITLEFMRVSSYGSGTASSGFINIKQDIDANIMGKNVLIIEDIIDSGNTLYRLKNVMEERGPKSFAICALLDKPERRVSEVEVKYTGRKIANEFVVGYGLDYNERYRNLPYVGILKREIYE